MVEVAPPDSKINYNNCIYNVCLSVAQRSGWSPAPEGFAPSIDWQMQQAADFADIRQVLHIDNKKNFVCAL